MAMYAPPILANAFNQLHIGLASVDHLAVDGRHQVLALRIPNMHLEVDRLRRLRLLLRHRNGLPRRRLEASKPERRQR